MNKGKHLFPQTAFTIRLRRNAEKKHLKDFQDFVDIVDTCGQSTVMRYHNFFKIHCSLSQVKYTASKPQSNFTREVKECFGKHHTHKKSSTVLSFFKESSLKVLEMISSKSKSLEVSVPAKKEDIALSSPQGITTAI